MKHRESTLKAIENFSLKQIKKKRNRKNAKPEKEVEKLVCAWLKQSGFEYTVIESKSTYNPKAGRYISSQAIPGFPDIVATTPHGMSCYIELKAKGKRSTTRDNQKEFMKRHVALGAFCVVADSPEYLADQYRIWLNFMKSGMKEKAKEYLSGLLN